MHYDFEEASAILARTPHALDTLLRGLPDAWVLATEGADTWSAFDIVGHLIHADRTNWLQRARVILEYGDTRAFDPFDRLGQVAASRGRRLDDLLDEFAGVRQDSVRQLRALAAAGADLDRVGRHPDLGGVTLRQLLATWVVHDLDHLMQIARVLATQYAGQVGPWREYLRILGESSRRP